MDVKNPNVEYTSRLDNNKEIYADNTVRRIESGFNIKLAFAIAASALGSSFQHGYNTGVLNNPETILRNWTASILTNRTGDFVSSEDFRVTLLWSVTVSIFCVGGMIGGSLTGFVAERFGRKGGLLLNNIFVLIAVIFEASSKAAVSYEMLIVGRFFIGINSGLNAGLAPMYLNEISPINLRGAIGTVYQLVITISILVAQILGLEFILGSASSWHVLLSLTIVATIFQLCTLPLCPESPKYLLIGKGQELEAQRALSWLRGPAFVHDEMDEMRSEYEASKLIPKVSVRELISNNALRIPLIISLTIMLAQQLSGINAVMFFSTRIFQMTGLSKEDATYATIGTGAINVIMTVVSLVLVEKAGRKTLLLYGFLGMTLCTLLLTITIPFSGGNKALGVISIMLVLLFVIMFAIGPGSIPWFLVSELFNQAARPTATSLAVAVNWSANFVVGLGFPPIEALIQSYVFLIFTVILILICLFVYKKVPETKNKTMEEISSMFRQQSYQ